MEVLLPEAGMIEKKKNETRFSVHLQRPSPKSPTCAKRHDGVLHRPDQTRYRRDTKTITRKRLMQNMSVNF